MDETETISLDDRADSSIHQFGGLIDSWQSYNQHSYHGVLLEWNNLPFFAADSAASMVCGLIMIDVLRFTERSGLTHIFSTIYG